jgi:isoleucyl-tRNA synthetase
MEPCLIRLSIRRRQADDQPLDPDRAHPDRAEVREAIEAYKFNEASAALYRFVWNQLCDWYLELLKPVFNGEDEAAKAEARACAAHVLAQSVKLLHPFMPFMTEELWASGRGSSRHLPATLSGPIRHSPMKRLRGNQLADRSRVRSPLGPCGDECSGHRQCSAGGGW